MMTEIIDIGNLCTHCHNDTSFGSGRFVNRIPSETETESGYMCPECQPSEEELKTYRVKATMESYCYIDIQAENPEEAWDIARDTDGGNFNDTGDGDWIVDGNVEEIKPKE